MPITSFPAKRLEDFLSSVGSSETVGLDTLRDIAAFARAIAKVIDDPPRKVLAWVLMKQMDALCDRYDGDPMTVDVSGKLVRQLRTAVCDAIGFLRRPQAGDESHVAVSLASELIVIGTLHPTGRI